MGYWGIAIPAALFLLLAALEYLAPRRQLALGRNPRWITHAIFAACNLVTGRAMILLASVGGAASWAQASGFGLFQLTSWPDWAEVLLAFIVLDFAVWLQHLLMHKIPLLWRMHKVHHSDRDLDVSSALRFHPFEIAVSVLYKSAWVALLGVPVWTALAFELWLNANALFNHSNIALPRRLDRILRLVLVTPDFHFVHHSVREGEQRRNYGFAISCWDRWSGRYQSESIDGRDGQIVGLEEAQDRRPAQTIWSILLPLR